MRIKVLVLMCAAAGCGRVAIESVDGGRNGGGGAFGGGLIGGGTSAGGAAGGTSAGGAAGGMSAGGTSAGGAAGGTSAGGTTGGGSSGGSVAGGSAGGAGGDPCVNLGVTACRANPRCTPDFCFQCSCRPNFAQCRLKTSPEYQCPQFGCPQPFCCKNDIPCGRPLLCLDPDAPLCGTCNPSPSTCTTDAECNPASTGNICRPRQCACSAESDCQPGCQTTGCGDGETCNQISRRCERIRCSPSMPCSSGLDCLTSSNGSLCVPRPCTNDEQCGDLFCVNGTCKSTMWVCGAIPP